MLVLSSILLMCLHVHSINSNRHSSTFLNEPTNVSISPSLPSNEFTALLDLYNSLNGSNWYWSNLTVRWNFSESDPNPCSGWYGLYCNCNMFSCHLTNLTLAEFGLQGTLPTTIGAWEYLLQFEVYENFITGTIPEAIGNWTAMEDLNMEINCLRGKIPISIGNLTNLQVFSVQNNLLTGIPPSLQNLTHLKEIYWSFNFFFGPFPQSIASLCCLQVMLLGVNLFSGTIPPLMSLSTLRQFAVNSNSFVGSTDSFQNMHSVFFLAMQINFLSGDCASDLNSVSNIGSLVIAENLFTGGLPFSDSWRGLDDYYAFDNYFIGTITEDFLNITSLAFFFVGGNYLTGTIHEYFQVGRLPILFSLNVSFNLLTGPLPSDISSVNVLSQFLVNNNFLTGSVPASFSKFNFLTYLWLNNNDLSGTIPFPLAIFPYLQEFFVQNNYFEGSVSDLLISLPEHSDCQSIDLSNNFFTGSLVASFFSSQPSLYMFAAANNCLEGTIPVEICNLEYLATLALDGMSTTENCRTLFFPGTIFTGFYASNSVASTFPSCLFTLPNLESLHLSGNGFSGSIPSSLDISKSLVDLSLSNNELTGSIPENFQNKTWQNLDLSYNKISGTLSDSFSLIPSDGFLYLEVNRLSGAIPTQLLNVESINILNGNIFSCDSNADLPIHDPAQQTYSCGSDSVNDFLYLWISCFAISGILFSLFYYAKMNFIGRFRPEVSENEAGSQAQTEELTSKRMINPLQTLIGSLNLLSCWHFSFAHYCDQNPSGNISVLRTFFKSIRKGFSLLGLLALVLLLPIYSVVTSLSSTYQFEYAWSVSAILLSGEFAAVILFVSFFIISVLFMLILQYVLYNIDLTDQAGVQRQQTLSVLNDFISFAVSKIYKRHDEDIMTKQKYKSLWLVYIAVTIVDLVLYGLADISYVVIVITYNSTIKNFAVVGLAFYKFLLNDFILSKSIPIVSSFVDRSFVNSVQETGANKPLPRRISDYRFTIADISFLEHLMLVNHVVLPILSVLAILPDCFYNAFFAASPTSSSYVFQDNVENGFGISGYYLNQETEFTPPFFYSYQCASKVLISFVPLYIMKFCYVGFLRPLKHLFAKLGYDYCYANYGDNSKLWKVFRFLLPTTLRNLQPEVSSRPVYQRLSITIQLSSYFAILVVFGTLFPPLAVLGSVSVLSLIFFEEVLLGRVLFESSRAGYEWYKQRLEDDCDNIRETILVSAQSTLFVSCCFFAFLLFDTWGDRNGWRSALPISCCILVPCLLFRLYQMPQFLQFSHSGGDKEDKRNRSISEDHVEMITSITTENPLLHCTVVIDTGEK
jgi:Leucine-rich repeat (LRR) protein